jgi:hypothetical protein
MGEYASEAVGQPTPSGGNPSECIALLGSWTTGVAQTSYSDSDVRKICMLN